MCGIKRALKIHFSVKLSPCYNKLLDATQTNIILALVQNEEIFAHALETLINFSIFKLTAVAL